MMKVLTRILFCLALLVFPSAPAHSQANAPRPRPKLVMLVVVDQFRYDYFPRFRDHYNGGFITLLDRGANFVDAHVEHYPAITSLSHATIMTGATPAITGIVGNDWYDREAGTQVVCTYDPAVQPLGDGVKGNRAAGSPRRMLVDTVGDSLKRAHVTSTTKVIGVAFKPFSAIFPSGRMADAAYWFDEPTGQFITSTYYAKELPAWLREFNSAKYPQSFANKVWLEGAEGRPERRLPDTPGAKLNAAMYASPLGNDLLELLAERIVAGEKLGQRGGTDVFTVSFSSGDAAGHFWGPDSPELREISIQQDRALGRLFANIDKAVGLGNVLVIMAGDHGVAPIPELLAEEGMPGGRVHEPFFDPIQKALEARYGPGKWLASVSGTSPYLNYQLMEEKNLDPEEVRKVAARAMAKVPAVARVYTRDQLMFGRATADRIDSLIMRSFCPKRSGDLEVILDPFWIRFEGERTTTHGAVYNYDTHVPIVFMGPGIRPGRYYQRAVLNDIAPTVAAMLDISPPAGSVGRILHEMFLPELAVR